MLGPQSDSDSGNEAPGQGAKSSVHVSTQSWQHAEQRNCQRLVPRGPSEQHQSSDPIIASLDAADVRETGKSGAQSKSEREHEHEHEEGHNTEAALSRKQKRGKRKPASQLQRVQAEVQAKKASTCWSLP